MGAASTNPPIKVLYQGRHGVLSEACIWVLGIQDINHFTSRDIGYYPFYLQGYGILCSMVWLLSGILTISEN